MSDNKWEWSEEFLDYYQYRRREAVGKSSYDLVWGRSQIGRTNPPHTSPDTSMPQSVIDLNEIHTNHTPIAYSPSSEPTLSKSYVPHIQAQPSHFQDNAQAHGQLRDYTQSITPGLAQRANNNSSPFSPYHIPHGALVIPYAASMDESPVSTSGSRFMTPTTNADTQSLNDGPRGLQHDGAERTATPFEILGTLSETNDTPSDSLFEIIRNPRGFFKKGKIFKAIWSEPRGDLPSNFRPTTSDRSNTPTQPLVSVPSAAIDAASPFDELAGSTDLSHSIHTKARMFVVVRQKAQHCICLPIYTYSQQGTSKPGVKPEDHAPLIPEGTEVLFHPEEQQNKLRKRLFLIVEDVTVQWSPLSRINFTKMQTVEYNLKVRKIGRLAPESLADLELLFREGIGLSED